MTIRQRLFNPFIYAAGNKALSIGWGAIAVTALVASLGNVHFDGVIDVHKFSSGAHTAPFLYFIEPFIGWLSTVIVFYAAGSIFSRSSIRLIDIAGTMALARWPMIFAALIIGFMIKPGATMSVDEMLKNTDLMISLVVAAFLTLPFTVWMIALMYNAYTVSCNMKGSKAVISFIVSLLVSEITASTTIHLIYNHSH